MKKAIAPRDAGELRARLNAHLKELIAKVEVFTDGYPERMELGTRVLRRPKMRAAHYGENFKTWLSEARQLRPYADEIEAYLFAVFDETGRSTVTKAQFATFVDYVLRRRMSKEGRFIRVYFTTGVTLDLVPFGSLASGVQLVCDESGAMTAKSVEPSVSLLWREFVAHGHSEFGSAAAEVG